MCFVRKGLDWVFTRHELTWLDDIMPEHHKKEKEEKKKQRQEIEAKEAKGVSVKVNSKVIVKANSHVIFKVNSKVIVGVTEGSFSLEFSPEIFSGFISKFNFPV